MQVTGPFCIGSHMIVFISFELLVGPASTNIRHLTRCFPQIHYYLTAPGHRVLALLFVYSGIQIQNSLSLLGPAVRLEKRDARKQNNKYLQRHGLASDSKSVYNRDLKVMQIAKCHFIRPIGAKYRMT